MQQAHPSRGHGPVLDPITSLANGLTAWHGVMVELPLRLMAETMRFTGQRLQAQAQHLTTMARCRSLEDVVALQTTFVTKGVSDYRSEASTLSQDVAEATFAKAA